MKEILNEDLYLQKMADAAYIPLEYVMKMRGRGWLDEKAVASDLIRQDFEALNATRKMKPARIYERLAEEYGVSVDFVRRQVSLGPQARYHCRYCGREISKRQHAAYDGVCNRCVARLGGS